MAGIIGALPSSIALGLIWGLLAIGLFISYKVMDIADLTVDGSFGIGAVVGGVILYKFSNGTDLETITTGKKILIILIAILAAIIAGIIAGLITGAFHTLLGIPAILSGILSQLILWSLFLKVAGFIGKGSNIPLPAKTTITLLNGLNDLKAIAIALVIVVIIIGLLYWFFGTEKGCSIRATGNNEAMATANGIDVRSNKMFGLALSNGLVALSGFLYAQYSGSADINNGRGAIVIGLASIIIGTAIAKLLSTNFAITLAGCVVGSIIYQIIYQIVTYIPGFDTDLLKMISALLVALFLGIPYLLKRKKAGGKYARN